MLTGYRAERYYTTHRFILPQSENMGSDVQLYDRVSDPGERTNVAAEWPILSEYLRILLTPWKLPRRLFPRSMKRISSRRSSNR